MKSELEQYWEVKTEGDIEGRTMKSLGMYYGRLEEIALFLANKAMDKLYFKKCDSWPPLNYQTDNKQVHVSLDFMYDIALGHLNTEEQIGYVKTQVADKPEIQITKSNLFKTMVITQRTQEDMIKAINQKLTAEENAFLKEYHMKWGKADD